MDNLSKIKELTRKVAGTDQQRFNFRLMEVVSVEGDTCSAKMGNTTIPRIRLAAIVGGAAGGIRITPAPGSIILVADLSCGELRELAVVGYSEIESIEIQGGDNGGLVKVEQMVAWMQKVHADLLTLQTLLASTPVAGNGAPLGAVFTPSTPAPAANNFENAKIKH